MIPDPIKGVLDESGVGYCLIGAHALAVHGVARYTADVDLLTLDPAVLEARFWGAALQPTLRRGDATDPLVGLARFEEPAVDIIVGRGSVMRRALECAVHEEQLGCRVVTPLWLALLKLEAGGIQDLADVHLLVEAKRRAGEDLRSQIDSEKAMLSEWGHKGWARLTRDLDDRS